jgi:hypothetical protein
MLANITNATYNDTYTHISTNKYNTQHIYTYIHIHPTTTQPNNTQLTQHNTTIHIIQQHTPYTKQAKESETQAHTLNNCKHT